MKKIDLGQAVTILANLGVIGGIVFLGFELRQNHLVGRTQTQTAIADARRELTQLDLTGPMVEILLLREREEDLTDEQALRLDIWIDLWMKHYANVYYQSSQGLYDDEEYQAYLRELEFWMQGEPSVADYFCRFRISYSTSFVDLVGSMLEENCRQ